VYYIMEFMRFLKH